MTRRHRELLILSVLTRIDEVNKLLEIFAAESPLIPEYLQESRDLIELKNQLLTAKTTD